MIKNKKPFFITSFLIIFFVLLISFLNFQKKSPCPQNDLFCQGIREWPKYKDNTNFSYTSIRINDRGKVQFNVFRDNLKTKSLFYENDQLVAENIHTATDRYEKMAGKENYSKTESQSLRYIKETMNKSESDPGEGLALYMNNNEFFKFNYISEDPEIEGCQMYKIEQKLSEDELKEKGIMPDSSVDNLRYYDNYISISEKTKKVCQFKFERKDVYHIEQIIFDYSPVNLTIPQLNN